MKAPAADLDIRDNYLNFINKSKIEYNALKKKFARVVAAKQETYDVLFPCKEDIWYYFKLHITDETDFIALKDKVLGLVRKHDDNSDRRLLLIQLIKYCSICTTEQEVHNKLVVAEKKLSLSFTDYRYYVFKYYSKVHKFLLLGKGYKFSNGIGIVYLYRKQITGEGHKIDFHKTKLRKEELLKQGIKLYNKYEADRAAALGVPYNGIDYRVWLRKSAYYSIRFSHSRYFRKTYDFSPVSYIHQKYRDYSQDTMATELCKSNEDIYDLQIDLRTKLDVYLKRNPERYIDFERINN